MRGSEGNEVNTFYQEFSARINYTGVASFITLDDSLQVIYGLENLVPNSLKGYLGQYDITVADTTSGVELLFSKEERYSHAHRSQKNIFKVLNLYKDQWSL